MKKLRLFFREAILLSVAIFFVAFVIRFTEAGSLTPTIAPASTANTMQELYNPLVGVYNSASTTSNMSGSALEILKCFITRENGGSC